MALIDKETIRKEIERLIGMHSNEVSDRVKKGVSPIDSENDTSMALIGQCHHLLGFLDTLPDEPKKPDKFPGITRFCDVADNLTRIASGEQPVEGLDAEMFKEWRTTKEEYLAKSMDKVHLEMEIATYLQDWGDDDEIGLHLSTDEGCMPIELEDVRDLARHFAEWGAEHARK